MNKMDFIALCEKHCIDYNLVIDDIIGAWYTKEDMSIDIVEKFILENY